MNFSEPAPAYRYLKIQSLEIPHLANIIDTLPQYGKIKINNSFSYLDIDNEFIHSIHPLLKDKKILKPDYFTEKTNFIGAHISTSYPEEQITLAKEELATIHHFKILRLFTAEILNKKFFALKVQAPTLIALRAKYNLPAQLQFNNYLVDLHITVGWQ